MLRCLQLEEIERHLLEVPSLADSYERSDPEFTGRLVAWLAKLENAFQQNRMAAVGLIAGERIRVLSAGRGVVPEGIKLQGRATPRKIRDATAIHALRTAIGLAESSIAPDRARHRDAQDLVRRVVAVAVAKQLSGYGPHCGECTDAERWSAVMSDSDTQAGIIQLEGLVGRTDALILLNRGSGGD